MATPWTTPLSTLLCLALALWSDGGSFVELLAPLHTLHATPYPPQNTIKDRRRRPAIVSMPLLGSSLRGLVAQRVMLFFSAGIHFLTRIATSISYLPSPFFKFFRVLTLSEIAPLHNPLYTPHSTLTTPYSPLSTLNSSGVENFKQAPRNFIRRSSIMMARIMPPTKNP